MAITSVRPKLVSPRRAPRATAVARVLALLTLVLVAVLAAPACETFDPPPQVFLVDLVDGNLPDNKAPLVIRFSEPVVAETLSLKVILLETDTEGNLFDEDDEDATDEDGKATALTTFFDSNATGDDVTGEGVLSDDRLTYTITLEEPLPIGPALALIVEPGLADDQGIAWQARQRILFGYRFTCSDAGVSQIFEPGAYFFVANVEKPLPTQLQLIVWFDVDPVTGVVTGQFTNADRNPGPTCGCPEDDACSSVDPAKCVLPSAKAGDEDEYADFLVPNFEPPEGYTFKANVCAVDQPDGTVAFANAPVDVAIEQPPVTVVATRLTAQFVKGPDGVLRCSGSVTGEEVLLGTANSGTASGTFVGRKIPDDEVPETIPKP